MAMPHNSAARWAVPFPPSPSCRNLDLPPVNLRFLQANLEKNSLAHRLPHLCGIALCNEKKEFVLSKQLLRSGTSIGANIAESTGAVSKNDFLFKMHIALKETNETLYWLELLHETEYLTLSEYDSLKTDCEEMRRMLSSITKTMSQTNS